MSVLDDIVATVTTRLNERQRFRPLAVMQEEAASASPRASFREALAAPGTSLIAEAKRRSPSRGLLREPYDPVELGRIYEREGARAMSVLTEPDYFAGAAEHLQAVAGAISLPLLRKDFVVSEYQIWEAKAWGASAVLLIVSVLHDSRLDEFLHVADAAGLDALVEVHSEEEAEFALRAPVRVLGVNNRNLATFETNRETTARIAPMVPDGTLLVSESGIFERSHVEEVEAMGARAVLIGEAIVTADSPAARIQALLGREETAS